MHVVRCLAVAAISLASISFATSARGQDVSADASATKPRVLILGDSISIGYTPFVKTMLQDDAFVYRPTAKNGGDENCAGTTNGIAKIDDWLAREGGNWDVIHVNFGLHDIKHVDPKTNQNSDDPGHPHQADPEPYRENLDAILAKCRATGAKLIVATTTPVPEGGVKPFRDPADVAKYNAIVVDLAKKHDAEVNDLYAFAEPRLAKIQRPVNVHFTDDGSQALAEQVASKIRQTLAAADASQGATKAP